TNGRRAHVRLGTRWPGLDSGRGRQAISAADRSERGGWRLARFWAVGIRAAPEFWPERLSLSRLRGGPSLSDEVRNSRLPRGHQRVFYGHHCPHHAVHRAGHGWFSHGGPGQPQSAGGRKHHQRFSADVSITRDRLAGVRDGWHVAGLVRGWRELQFNRRGQRLGDL